MQVSRNTVQTSQRSGLQISPETKQWAEQVGSKILQNDKDIVYLETENEAEKIIDHAKTAQANYTKAKSWFGRSRKSLRDSLFVELNRENLMPTLGTFAKGVVSGVRGLVNLYQAGHHATETAKSFLFSE